MMKRTAELIALVLICLCVLPAPAMAQEQWAVMIYMIGADLDERGLAAADLQEILNVSSQKDAPELWICTGGSDTGWQMENIPEDECVVWQAQNGRLHKRASLGSAAMGEANTLQKFVSAVSCAGKQTMLVLWDHGRGPLFSVGPDDDPLTLDEVDHALRGRTFDVIGLDACLMSSIEAALALEKHAAWAVLSQEAEPETGWDYTALSGLNGLNAQKAACVMASAANAAWQAPYRQWKQFEPPLSIAVLDLGKAASVRSSLQVFLEKIANSMELSGFQPLSRTLAQTCQPGRFTMAACYDLFDIKDLSKRFEPYFPQESAQLLDALDEMIIQNHSNMDGMNGLSMYLPKENQGLYQAQRAQLERVAACDAQTKIAAGIRARSGSSAYQTLALPQAGTEDVRYALTPEQLSDFESARILLYGNEEDVWVLYGMSREAQPDENGVLSYTFTDRALYLTNAQGERALLPLLDMKTSGEITHARSFGVLISSHSFDFDGLYQPGGMTNALLDLAFDEEGNASLTTLLPSQESTVGKILLRMEDYAEILISCGGYLPTYTGGRVNPFADWTYAPAIQVTSLSLDNTALCMAPYPEDAALYAQFQISAGGVWHASELIPVRTVQETDGGSLQ